MEEIQTHRVEERLLRFPRRRLEPPNLAMAAPFAREALEKLPEPESGEGHKRGELSRSWKAFWGSQWSLGQRIVKTYGK